VSRHSLSDVPPEVLARFDQRCEAFEAAWRNGTAPPLEAVLRDAAGPDYRPLLRFALELEWGLRREAGLPVVLSDYLGRFGDDDFVRAVFAEGTTGPGGPCAEGPPRVPRYEILREIGRGGMGVVYLARQAAAGNLVALKLTRPGDDPEDFRREARAAGVVHAHVVRVYEVNAAAGRAYFTMEHCDGGTLKARLDRGPLDPAEAAGLVARLARGVQAIHDRRLLHRDLKPANVLLVSAAAALPHEGPGPACPIDGLWFEPKVADFGLALDLDVAGTARADRAAGTPPYMAPEQARGDERLSPAVDVYGLGAILYECLTGRPPFQGARVEETLRQILTAELVEPRRLNPAVDPGLDFICRKCLDRHPARRYRSAGELADDLGRWRDGEGPLLPGCWEGLLQQFQAPCRVERPAEWARVCFALAGWRTACHLAMALLLAWQVAPAAYWAWFVVLHAGGWLLVGLLRAGRRYDRIERGVLLNWAATTAADALLLGLFCPPWGPARPDEVVRVYPAWLTLHGLWYVTEARRFWGRCYVVGFGFLALVPILAILGPLTPVAYAAVNAAMLTWLGLGLYDIASRRPAPAT